MNILTGVVVSVLLMSLLFLWAYSDKNFKKKTDEIIVNVCAAAAGVSLMLCILLAGHWTAVLFGKL